MHRLINLCHLPLILGVYWSFMRPDGYFFRFPYIEMSVDSPEAAFRMANTRSVQHDDSALGVEARNRRRAGMVEIEKEKRAGVILPGRRGMTPREIEAERTRQMQKAEMLARMARRLQPIQ